MAMSSQQIPLEHVYDLVDALRIKFNVGLEQGQQGRIYPIVADEVPSTGSGNIYEDYSELPFMQEWIGDKRIDKASMDKWTVPNKDFSSALEVHKNRIADGQTASYGSLAQGMGRNARMLPDQLLSDLVNGIFTAKAWDSELFISAAHGNKMTKALSSATRAAADASLGAALALFAAFKNSAGKSLRLVPNVLYVPPALKLVADTLATADLLDDGKPNPYKGYGLTVVVDPDMTSATQWMLLCTNGILKPFIYQNREAPNMVESVSADSQERFMRGNLLLSFEARGAMALGPYTTIVASTGTT